MKTWTKPKVIRKATTHEAVQAADKRIKAKQEAEAEKAARDKKNKKPK